MVAINHFTTHRPSSSLQLHPPPNVTRCPGRPAIPSGTACFRIGLADISDMCVIEDNLFDEAYITK